MRKTYRRKSYKKKLTTRRRQRKNHKKSVRNHKRKTFRHKGKIGGDEEVNIPTIKGLEEGDRVFFQIKKPIFKDEMERIEDEQFIINAGRTGIVYSKPKFTADPDVYLVRLHFPYNSKVYDFYFTNNIEKADNKHINQILITRKMQSAPLSVPLSEDESESEDEDDDMPSVPAYVSSPQSWRPSDNGDFE